MTPLRWILAILALQRLAELFYAQRNTRRLLARGAIEIAPRQYRWFVLLHAAWLAAMLAFIPANAPPNWWIVAILVLLQAARIWTIATLGPYWTTRVITQPAAPLVRRGPYAFMRHPNYAIVCAEIALVPLAFSAWAIAVAFSAANATLIAFRIRAENAALEPRRRGAWHT
jgi:methyltransferase